MIIGVPKEIKDNENRVALTPAGAKELKKRGKQNSNRCKSNREPRSKRPGPPILMT